MSDSPTSGRAGLGPERAVCREQVSPYLLGDRARRFHLIAHHTMADREFKPGVEILVKGLNRFDLEVFGGCLGP